ncbi:MAG: hypothetical protein WBW93_14435 [Steroidobacteraceae bacterium]
MRYSLLVGVILGVVSTAALAMAIVALQDVSTLTTELRTARRQLRALSDNAEVAETAREVHSLSGKLNEIGPKLGALFVCVPELQGEINGLSINWELPGSFSERKARFEIDNTQQISSNCNGPLYGTKE